MDLGLHFLEDDDSVANGLIDLQLNDRKVFLIALEIQCELIKLLFPLDAPAAKEICLVLR